ncbi:hypothetical protein [Photorhabdus antumapuensis]|nr:hypothetical protein [Photorhabdus antumapuensis]MCA6222182.1 hypothetical protein [Photorhabdus antumapuensis]
MMIPIVIALTLVGFGFGWPHLLTCILLVSSDRDKDIAGAVYGVESSED